MTRATLLVVATAWFAFALLPPTVGAREYGQMAGDTDAMAVTDAVLDLAQLMAGDQLMSVMWQEMSPTRWDELVHDLAVDAPTSEVKKLLSPMKQVGRQMIVERLRVYGESQQVAGFCAEVLRRYMTGNRGATTREAKAKCIALSREAQRRVRAHNQAWDKGMRRIVDAFTKALAASAGQAPYIEEARDRLYMLLAYQESRP